MGKAGIVTVGLAPAWDVVCSAGGLEWGQHRTVETVSEEPAGKSLNVSRALDWMGIGSVAGGVWGKEDIAAAMAAIKRLKNIKPAFTAVAGRTRRNINLLDPVSGKELHLRLANELANAKTIAAVKKDVAKIVRGGDLVVFSGSLPGGCAGEALGLVEVCRRVGGRIVVDSSGAGLKAMVKAGGLLLIKPNVEELSELVGRDIANTEAAIIKAATPLLDRTAMVLVSRGAKGAILVKKGIAISGSAVMDFAATSTLACGDYLLAGFLGAYSRGEDLSICLSAGLKAATGKAIGLDEMEWPKVAKKIKVEIRVRG
ncbi:MAG: hypothetical protein A2Y07_10020 [Planctomycetes bacterium GWF2_50_10]|nr:MAG: hypothetical protein A2Y07_10020 [Planctomycetes bacterium GWF2_50_10]